MKQKNAERNKRIHDEYYALIAMGAPKMQTKHIFMDRYGLRSINAVTNAIQNHAQTIKP